MAQKGAISFIHILWESVASPKVNQWRSPIPLRGISIASRCVTKERTYLSAIFLAEPPSVRLRFEIVICYCQFFRKINMQLIAANGCKKEGMEALLFTSTPHWSFNSFNLEFLNALFYSCKLILKLASVIFQPFLLFFRGYVTSEENIVSTAVTSASPKSLLAFSCMTHYLSPPFCMVQQCGREYMKCARNIIKYLSNYLTIRSKKITYLSRDLAFNIFSRTFCNFFSNSFSYFTRVAKLALLSHWSLHLPIRWHPHVHTSFIIQRHFSSAISSIEYGIKYPFLLFRTRPECFSILRCWETAEGVMPNTSAISLTPIEPLDFNSSIILTRVSTPNTLNISEGNCFISIGSCFVKYFSRCLNILLKYDFVKYFFITKEIDKTQPNQALHPPEVGKS